MEEDAANMGFMMDITTTADSRPKARLHAPYLYRLLRFVSTTGAIQLHADRTFSLTKRGTVMQKNHPMSLRGITLLEESIQHRRTWEHLEEVIREGPKGLTGFARAYGKPWVEMLFSDEAYTAIVNEGMASFTAVTLLHSMELNKTFDWSTVMTVVDLGGNEGHLLAAIAKANSNVSGYVLDVPPVIANSKVPETFGVANRVRLVGASMSMQHIDRATYIDWSDDECVVILKNIYEKAPAHARIVNFDFMVPGPGQPDNGSMGLDVHMMAAVSGRDREEVEMRELFGRAGWKIIKLCAVAVAVGDG
ncbi:O-methyltransferase-domain-containing protein [Chytridium lagenaria]|nr:O-methyltransferase-domain-containing protein [Chytridium lagenaria]